MSYSRRIKIIIITLLLVMPFILSAAEVLIDNTVVTNDNRFDNASPQIVWISDTEGFVFYNDDGNDFQMASTTNSGATWGNFQLVDSINTTDGIKVSVWYDRWTPGDTTGNKIHISTFDSGSDDTYYTEYDTVSNTLSTTVLTVAEAGVIGNASVSGITKAENGDLYVSMVDNSDSWVHTCSTTCTSSSNWSAITSPWSGSNGDNDASILLPLAGTNNIMSIWWDVSDHDIESNIYSATSSTWWGWNTSLNQDAEDNVTYYQSLIGATLNRTTGEIYLVNGDDADEYTIADHDLQVWEFNNSTYTWSQKTNILSNDSGGLQGVKIAVDENTGNLHVVYSLRSTISDTNTGQLYVASSTDNGATWSATTTMSLLASEADIRFTGINIMSNERIGAVWKYVDSPKADDLYYIDIIDLVPATGVATVGRARTLRFGTLILLSGTLILY